MTVGIKYTSFETLILETSDANNETAYRWPPTQG